MRKAMVNAGLVLLGIALIAVVIGAFWAQFYSLSSPEAYVEVERWKAIIGYSFGAVALIVILGVALFYRDRR